MAAKLANLNPAEAWAPAPEAEWSLKWAAHLYRRAAFGFPAADDKSTGGELLARAAGRSREACVEELLSGGEGQPQFNELMDVLGGQIAKVRVPRFQPPRHEKLQGWWLYRMFHTPHPLLERCTLFWHNHFATSIAKVRRSELMYKQNGLFRAHALGKFEPLLTGISRDPAMLIWLDSNSNIKGQPNENLAREIMEKLAAGIDNDTAKQAGQLLDLLLQNDVAPEARAKLIEFAAGENAGDNRHRHLREITHTILLMPEFQLA